MSDEKIVYPHKKIVQSPSFLDNRGYKIKIPTEFVEKFVEIWNRSYTSNINAEMATKFITHLVQTLIVLVDNCIPIFLYPFFYIKPTTREAILYINNEGSTYKNREVHAPVARMYITNYFMRIIVRRLNPQKEYWEFVKQKHEVQRLYLKNKHEEKIRMLNNVRNDNGPEQEST